MISADTDDLPRLTDEYRARYQETGAWPDEIIFDRFAASLEEHPESEIVGPSRTVTYEELMTDVEKVSAGLQKLGVEYGDVVSYQLPNWVATSAAHLAITRAGGVANAIVPIYRHREVGYILADAESKVLFIPEEFRDFDYPEMVTELVPDCPTLEHVVIVGSEDSVEDVDADVETWSYEDLCETDPDSFTRPDMSANDIHALLYTSGTTADPKGVLHTHNTLMAEERAAADLQALSYDTTVFMPSPVTHVTGMLYGLEMPLREGMDIVFQDIWEPERGVELIDQYGCNTTVVATPFLKGINEQAPNDWDCPLRAIACGGAEVPPELVYSATENLDSTIWRVYGSTEYPTITWPPLDAPTEKMAETDGPAAPDTHVKIVDPKTGEELPAGEQGEILAHGPELMAGYLDESNSEDAFDGKWFKTGDLGVRDEYGYLEVSGRIKDIIIRGGENIPVKDVEDILFEHAAINDVAVVAMPDPELQEKGCAYVKLEANETLTFDEMVEYLDQQGIAKQKYPERIETIDKFSRTASGNIEKAALRKDIADKLGRDPITRD